MKLLTETTTEVAEKASFLSNDWIVENKPALILTFCVIGLVLAGIVVKKVCFKKRGYRG